jgi:hypothetical protein
VDIIYPITWYVIFILSATIHEAAHALAAKLGGDLTAYLGGQVSLNPVPHIKREPFGMVIFPLISAFLIGWPFGYAKTPTTPFGRIIVRAELRGWLWPGLQQICSL